jgi:glycosyltransferase involved in cell wall biosynthesis
VKERSGFVFVGRLGFEKGPDIAARVCARIGAELTVVGEGDLGDELRRSGSGVRMLGWQDRDGVAAAMASARALLFPSRWLETFGLTPIEALALGTPVVVSKNAAVADLVVEGVDGYVFDPADENSLARILLRLQDDAHLDPLLQSVATRRSRWHNADERHAVALARTYKHLQASSIIV